MAIPDFNEHGLLPPGIYDCAFDELEDRFGRDQWVKDENPESARREYCSPQRSRLCTRLKQYLEELRQAGIDAEVLVDGSFVTDKPDPNDVDLIVVLPADHDFTGELSPRHYELLSGRRARRAGYPFDLFTVAEGSAEYRSAFDLFEKVKNTDLTKGFLRVKP
jgi:hypothetical protein